MQMYAEFILPAGCKIAEKSEAAKTKKQHIQKQQHKYNIH